MPDFDLSHFETVAGVTCNAAAAAVPSQNLNPDVLMMKPAEDWYCCDAADLLRTPKIRSTFAQ
jgi:hypothetical protein